MFVVDKFNSTLGVELLRYGHRTVNKLEHMNAPAFFASCNQKFSIGRIGVIPIMRWEGE